MTTYDSEAGLVERFLERLHSGSHPWDSDLNVVTEFYYLRGRTDVVAVSPEGEVVAFEAKLTRWKEALYQAYRNTCFAHRSYVLLPESAISSVACKLKEFKRRKVGLCFLGTDAVVILEEAPHSEPLQPHLAAEAVAKAEPNA